MSLSSDISSVRWHVVQTQANREVRAGAELLKQGFEVFLPRYLKVVRHARRVTKLAAPLFPGYLFTRFAADARWRSVNGTIGVIRLVTAGERPASLAEGIVEGLMALQDGRGYVPLPRRAGLAPGESVRVADGVFADTLGLYEEAQDSDRVAILIELLGRKVRLQLDGGMIEKAA